MYRLITNFYKVLEASLEVFWKFLDASRYIEKTLEISTIY